MTNRGIVQVSKLTISEMKNTAFIIYLVTLAISPLLFGAVYTFAYSFIFLAILFASLLLLRSNLVREDKTIHFRWIDTDLNPLFFVFLVFIILQMIPLPDFLIARLSPSAKVAGEMSLPAVSVVDHAALKGHWYALASYIYPVRMSLIHWIVYGLLFFGLVHTLNSRRRIELAVMLILAVGCFESFYGIIQTYSHHGNIGWMKQYGGIGDVSGTYDNRNHFAGLMEMGIILAIAWAGARSERSDGKRSLSSRKKGFKALLTTYISSERLFTKRVLIVFMAVIMGLGLVLSASRGGIISIVMGLLVMGLFFIFRKDYRKKGALILILFAVTLIYGLFIGMDYTVGRFKSFDQAFESRTDRASRSMLIYEDYRLAGVGIGNFEYVFPRYQGDREKHVFVNFVENDWIQFMAEAGLSGLILLLAGIAYYIFRVLRKWTARQEPFAVCLGIAPIAAMAAMGIHSCSDFNLHIPSNFMMLAAVAAIGYSALHLEKRHGREKLTYRYHFRRVRWGGIFLPFLLLIFILWSGVWTVCHFIAEAHCNTVHTPSLNLNQNPSAEEIRKAISWDPGNAQYRYKLARELMNIRDKEIKSANQDIARWHEQRPAIIAALEEAIRLNPFRAEYHMRLGWEYSFQWNQPDYYQKWFPAADISMERAAHFAGVSAENPHIHVDLGNYWTMRSKTFNPSDMNHEVAWTKAVWHYKKALELENSKPFVEEITRYVKSFYPDEEHMKDIIGDFTGNSQYH